MKRLPVLAACSAAALSTLLVAPAGLAATTAGTPAAGDGACPTLQIAGHRGSGGTAPENTAPAFDQARASGADYLETDIQLSADGVPFLFHDGTAKRTTDVEEVFPDRAGDPITSFTWAELQQLDAGSYFALRYDDVRIPAFDDAALAVGDSDLVVNIELKDPASSPGVEQVLADELLTDPLWTALVADGQVVVSSFDEQSLTTFHALAPEIPLLMIGSIPDDDATLQRWAGFAEGVVTNYRILDPADVDRVHAAGLTLQLYTLDSPEAVTWAAGLCVDGVITDFPRQMVRLQKGLDPLPQANGIVVSEVAADVPGVDIQPENGEYVELTNTSHRTIDVSGYLLQDAVTNRLVVGDGYTMAPGATLRVYTGPGTNTADRYYNDFGANVLNNDGDSIAVYSPQLRLLDLYAY